MYKSDVMYMSNLIKGCEVFVMYFLLETGFISDVSGTDAAIKSILWLCI